jgi:Na+-driven multidrug efflux pump
VDAQRVVLSPRTRLLLEGRIVPTLLRLAWPNVLVMLAQASTGLIETWFVSRLGTDALAGMALVFPGFMMMQMLSAGAVGGGISSAIARALGAGRRSDADALVWHAVIINAALGLFFSVLVLGSGRRSIARWAARVTLWKQRSATRTLCSRGQCWYG